MATTLTISITPQDSYELKNNPALSPSKIFRSAMKLHRSMEEFIDLFDIFDFKLALLDKQEKIARMSKEIERRNERIESLTDVLAQKELAERRLRKVVEGDTRSGQGTSAIEELRGEFENQRDQPQGFS
jgi:hypothetical protein